MESKWFDVEVMEQKGKVQATIVERKGGVSSWIRLGPKSIGCFIDGLDSCIKIAGSGIWERKWKESGRSYFMVRDQNKEGGGLFMRIGVLDLENKRFCIFIPKGRGDKSGWVLMVEMLCRLGCYVREESFQKNGTLLLSSSMGKTYAEVAKQPKERETAVVRVELCKRELSRNLEKLAHCLVGSWNPRSGKGDNLRGWGTHLVKFWSLKGNLGIAKLERGKILLEFEGEKRSEAWVRIVGLPVSLWERDILRRIGDACGGFLAIDSQTETLEDLQWARILVKLNDEKPPNVVEVWAEDVCYEITLWWEIKPVLRTAKERKGKNQDVSEGEVRGEAIARAAGRVRGKDGGPSLEVLLRADDGTRGQSSGSGQVEDPGSGSDLVGPHKSFGTTSQWASGPSDVFGPYPPTASPREFRPSYLGLPHDHGRVSNKLLGGSMLGVRGPASSFLWVVDGLWRPSAETQSLEENSKTNDALMEEALRESPDRRMIGRKSSALETVTRWELLEDNNGAMGASGKELCLASESFPEVRGWREASWEESELARFSQFLGFSTVGLEKDILEFMVKIRKRREKVHSKSLLEKSKFERELKRLECSINYEEGRKQKEANDSSKRKVIKAMIRSQRADLFCIQETKIQTMTEGVVRSLGSGRFLDWGAMGAQGSAGGILVCWDKRSLDLLEMEMGNFSISCRLKNVEDGMVWIFTGVYGPCNRKEREALWEELGAIRGLWDEPWCLGGDFNVTLSQRDRSRQGSLNGAMRRFAQVVDDLVLIDLPLQGVCFLGAGGVVQCRLPRPTSDHFPILLKGGEMSRDPLRSGLKTCGSRLMGLRISFGIGGREGLEVNKSSALQQIEFWDRVECDRGLSEREMDLKNEAKENFKKWALWKKSIGDKCLGSCGLEKGIRIQGPGPDGFTVAFWEACWDFVKEEVVELFKEFYDQKSFAKILNSTFLVIIPKKGGAEDLGEFRPISLLGGLYKLLAKVLANRLKQVLDKVVSADQNAFVRGRQILDASLIANEVVDYWQKRKEKGLVCKLDIKKA
ncbi:Transposon TX1 uncharacterized 149 kDa protein [Vitis vinifera]|uniref:Transposon TX1 uncharacterized 149 kDa protein n=1 Tax=Vitis vinifera TaxID=29760 RepID=A0A438F1C3_VITVI|nr:Transposon TX1 uncharacterized 149 kDa protein [Vitis vinifera]